MDPWQRSKTRQCARQYLATVLSHASIQDAHEKMHLPGCSPSSPPFVPNELWRHDCLAPLCSLRKLASVVLHGFIHVVVTLTMSPSGVLLVAYALPISSRIPHKSIPQAQYLLG